MEDTGRSLPIRCGVVGRATGRLSAHRQVVEIPGCASSLLQGCQLVCTWCRSALMLLPIIHFA
jgi:hypothetical protein